MECAYPIVPMGRKLRSELVYTMYTFALAVSWTDDHRCCVGSMCLHACVVAVPQKLVVLAFSRLHIGIPRGTRDHQSTSNAIPVCVH
eukprot:2805958-Prymnesium_polylepis.1